MTVIPDKHTFIIWQGATFFEVLTLYETDDRTQPRDLTDYTAEMIIRDKPRSENILLTLSTENGRITLPTGTENQGKIQLRIAAEDTADIDWKSGAYDLTITDTINNVTDALLYGGIKVNGV